MNLRSSSLEVFVRRARPVVRSVKQVARQLAPETAYLAYRRARMEWAGGQALRVMDRFADPRRTAIDVGANIGVLTAALARRFRTVVAYEPDPVNAAVLRRHAPHNVTVYPLALSQSDGVAVLRTPLWDGQVSRTHGSLTKHFEGSRVVESRVRTCRLDEMGHEDVAFLKVDVEGHETEVLRGAEGLLREHRPALWIEVERDHHPTGSTDEVFDLLTALGYKGTFWFQGVEHALRDFDPATHQPLVDGRRPPGPRVTDFLFVP